VFPLPEFEARLGVGSASADALLSMLAPFAGPVVALREPLTRYRIHDANDYASSSLASRVDRHVAVTDLQLPLVERYCTLRGRPVDAAAWRRNSYFHRVRRVRDAVRESTTSSSRVLLIDDGYWGSALDDSRRLVPFPAHCGEYWGPPVDDRHAVQALADERSRGATQVAIGWQSFWWAEAYPGFWQYLRQCTVVSVDTDDVLILSFPWSG
jgi:hypothetical protein